MSKYKVCIVQTQAIEVDAPSLDAAISYVQQQVGNNAKVFAVTEIAEDEERRTTDNNSRAE